MLRLLLALTPANLLHQLGTGRALENARGEQEDLARMVAVIDALAGRLQPAAPVGSTVDERVAA